MKKEPSPPPELSDVINEHPAMLWISEHLKEITIAVAAVIVFIALGLRFFQGGQAAEADYVQAQRSFSTFAQNPSPKARDIAFENLESQLSRHPELQAQYDGPLAQLLLIRDMPDLATPLAHKQLKRTRTDRFPAYASWTNGTLLIAGGELEEGLKEAKILHQTLVKNLDLPKEERHFGSLLFAFNLLRTATLEQKLGLNKDELRTWETWQRWAQKGTGEGLIDSGAFQQVALLFDEVNIPFDQYVSERLSLLKK